MQTFINDYTETSFEPIIGQGCKVKDNTLTVKLFSIPPRNNTKIIRVFIKTRNKVKEILSISQRTKIVKLSGYHSDFGERKLNKNIVTEIKTYKKKQVITVKTDIDSRFLKTI